MAAGKRSIWTNPVARRHLLGMWVNALGGGVFDIALPLIILLSTGSLGQMAAVTVAQQLPKAVPGIAIGAYVDRRAPRNLMLFGYTGQTVTMAVIPVMMLCGIKSLLLLLLMCYCRGVFDMFARTATFTSVPVMYGSQRSEFNAAFTTAWTSARIVGPAAGGVLAATIRPELLLIADALSFAVMAFITLTLPVPRHVIREPQEADSFWRSLTRGSMRLVRRRGSTPLIVSICSVGLLYAPLLTVALYVVSKTYNEDSARVGLVSAAGAVGLLGGSLLAHRSAHDAPRRVMLRGSVLMSVGSTAFFIPRWEATAVAVLVVCVGGLSWTVGRTNFIQSTFAQQDLGKTMTFVQFLETVTGPLSLLLATALVESLSPAAAFSYILVLAIVSGVAMAMTPSTDETSHEERLPDGVRAC